MRPIIRTAFILLLCTVSIAVYGQRQLVKKLVDKDAQYFYIDSQHAFKVELGTNIEQQILIKALVDGEYRKDLVLDVRQEGSQVYIGTGFHPDFQFINDKLSAHKVISVSLEISLPAEKSVFLKGVSSRSEIKGLYKLLHVEVKDGQCELDQVHGVVHVTTSSGDIWLKSKEGVVNADTEYGQISMMNLPLGDAEYSLKSVSGDIHVVSIPR